MGRKKVKHNYVTIKIPDFLSDKCDELIKKEGYTSRTSVIKRAIRNLYDEEIKGIVRVRKK